jgi:uncharacterized membrane protein
LVIAVVDRLLQAYFYFYISLFLTDYSFLGTGFKMSNISGFTGGLLIFFLARYLLGRDTFSHTPVLRQLRKIYSLEDKKLIFSATAALFILFSVLSITRHLSFSSGSYDLGIFDQAVWNTLKGDIMFSSIKMNMNLLGDHFEPALFLFVPLYAIWPSPIVLLVGQSLLLALSLIPFYLICKEKISSRFLIFSLIIAYMFSKPLRGVALSDFHLEAFVVPILFWLYYFILKKKDFLLWVFVVLLVSCKEDAAFLVSALGLFVFFSLKRRRLGLTLFIFGIASWIFLTKVFIPYFNFAHKYPYMDRLPFGLTYADNLNAVLRKPGILLETLGRGEKIEYIIQMLGPLGFISLLSPSHYILLAVPLLKNIFPLDIAYQGYWGVGSHYTAMVIPFVFISATAGAAFLMKKLRLKHAGVWIGIFITACTLFFFGKTDGNKLAKFMQGMKRYKSREVIGYLNMVPKDATVATNFNLVPHMSERKYIYEWNPDNPKTWLQEYILLSEHLMEYVYPGGKAQRIHFDTELFKRHGFKQVFVSDDGSFYVFKNKHYDKKLVEQISPN